MSQCSPAQYALPHDPALRTATGKALTFTISLYARNGAIVLKMDQDGQEAQDYIAITEDTMVEIVLKGDQLFFSKAFDAITMKDANLGAFYSNLEYDGYDEKLDRYKIVRFVARFNKGGKFGTTHAFNVNIDLLQKSRRGPRWIGMSIDPDIKNPPPKLN